MVRGWSLSLWNVDAVCYISSEVTCPGTSNILAVFWKNDSQDMWDMSFRSIGISNTSDRSIGIFKTSLRHISSWKCLNMHLGASPKIGAGNPVYCHCSSKRKTKWRCGKPGKHSFTPHINQHLLTLVHVCGCREGSVMAGLRCTGVCFQTVILGSSGWESSHWK